MKSSRMTTYILGAMVLGILVGGLIHGQFADPATQKLFSSYISLGSMIFLRLIKMIIAPLVFSTLVAASTSARSMKSFRVIPSVTAASFARR